MLTYVFFRDPLLVTLALVNTGIPSFSRGFGGRGMCGVVVLKLLVFVSLCVLGLPCCVNLVIMFLNMAFCFSRRHDFARSVFKILALATTVNLVLV